MRVIILTLVFMSWIVFIQCEIEPFVVGGKKSKITDFPHSVLLGVKCINKNGVGQYWICGASILNGLIALTAAHCLHACTYESRVTVTVGHAIRDKGFSTTVRTYFIHEQYHFTKLLNDIALLKLTKVLKLGDKVKRIALMKNPPYREKAQIAGWGMIDEDNEKFGNHLIHIDQYVWLRKECRQVIKSAPRGSICASSGNSGSFSSSGDSGCALVVRGYIQIGIVSYKLPSISQSLVVYTDTGYFYDWIERNSRRLYCVKEKPVG